MIVTDALATGRLIALAAGCRWFSLARRGMLWSEVQCYDLLALDPGAAADVGDDHYIELLYCLRGGVTLRAAAPAGARPAPGTPVQLAAGCVTVLRPGSRRSAAAGAAGSVLLRLRALPGPVARALPARQPALAAEGER